MKTIGLKEIEDIATGAALLGAGGGGDPYIGKLIAMNAVTECGEVKLIDPMEVSDDALVIPIAMMGAPTILCEKGISGNEYQTVYDMMSRYFQSRDFCNHADGSRRCEFHASNRCSSTSGITAGRL